SHTFGTSIAPDIIRQNCFMTFIDNGIAYALSYEMCRDGMQIEPVFLEECSSFVAVRLVGFIDFQMIAPCTKFESIVTKRFSFPTYFFNGKIGPLSGK